MQRVLEYEVKAERNPTCMPHNNPGYDVESRSDVGEVLRYIEVKGTEGEWAEAGVPLTQPVPIWPTLLISQALLIELVEKLLARGVSRNGQKHGSRASDFADWEAALGGIGDCEAA